MKSTNIRRYLWHSDFGIWVPTSPKTIRYLQAQGHGLKLWDGGENKQDVFYEKKTTP